MPPDSRIIYSVIKTLVWIDSKRGTGSNHPSQLESDCALSSAQVMKGNERFSPEKCDCRFHRNRLDAKSSGAFHFGRVLGSKKGDQAFHVSKEGRCAESEMKCSTCTAAPSPANNC